MASTAVVQTRTGDIKRRSSAPAPPRLRPRPWTLGTAQVAVGPTGTTCRATVQRLLHPSEWIEHFPRGDHIKGLINFPFQPKLHGRLGRIRELHPHRDYHISNERLAAEWKGEDPRDRRRQRLRGAGRQVLQGIVEQQRGQCEAEEARGRRVGPAEQLSSSSSNGEDGKDKVAQCPSSSSYRQ